MNDATSCHSSLFLQTWVIPCGIPDLLSCVYMASTRDPGVDTKLLGGGGGGCNVDQKDSTPLVECILWLLY